ENPGKLASAAVIAKSFTDSITEQISARVASGKKKPRLVGILATPSPPSIAYAESTKRACEAVGMEFDIWRTWDQKDDVEDLIIAANADESVDGIMVYFPVFGGRQDTYLSQIMKPSKDVEGLSFSFAWNLYHNVRWIAPSQLVKGILPCTPLAIVKCLEAMSVYDRSLPYGDRLRGKTITVINRSEVVGRPLAALLANDGARVFSVDLDAIQEFSKRGGLNQSDNDELDRQASGEVDLQTCLKASSVVISGVPSPNFKINTEWINEGSVCVNFSSAKNFEKDVRSRASLYLPSVGKMTCCMLQRNLLRLV
ncbi:hypothetical protein RGQ29_032302, partial [Quercus rubra]